MDDKTLLELAAKAAWIDWFESRAAERGLGLHMKSGPFWNPLTDDGDALRLAVKLNLWEAVRDGYQHVDSDNDFYAATRRAIVRAAAAIGESK